MCSAQFFVHCLKKSAIFYIARQLFMLLCLMCVYPAHQILIWRCNSYLYAFGRRNVLCTTFSLGIYSSLHTEQKCIVHHYIQYFFHSNGKKASRAFIATRSVFSHRPCSTLSVLFSTQKSQHSYAYKIMYISKNLIQWIYFTMNRHLDSTMFSITYKKMLIFL